MEQTYFSLKIPTDGAVECTEMGVDLSGAKPFSIQAWVWLNGMGDDIAVVSKASLLTFGIGHGRLFLQLPDQTTLISEADVLVRSGGWHYVVVCYDGHSVRFYIDSVLCGTTAIGWSGVANSNPYRVGANLDGRIRSLRVFTSSLDSDAVLADMFAPVARPSLCADFDCTCTPPIDRKRPTQPLRLVGRARVVGSVPALFLEGTAYVQPAQSESINPGGGQIDPYTIQASFYATGNVLHQTIFANGNHDTDSGVALYLSYETDKASYRACALRGTDFKASNKLFSTGLIKPNTWVNLAVVHDGQKMLLYIDGVLDAQATTSPILMAQLEGRVLIGGMLENNRPTGTNTLQGYIRQVDIWNTALTEIQVKTYCTAPPAIGTTGLVESFDLTNEPFRGIQSDVPLALCDGAKFHELTSDAALGSREAPPKKQAPIVAAPSAVRAERQKLDMTALERNFNESYGLSQLGNPAELACLLGFEPTQETMGYIARKVDAVRAGQGDRLLAVTHYLEGTDWVLVAHYRHESMAVGRFSLATTEECIILKIKLFFTLIGGAIAVLFGIRTTLSVAASNFIRNCILPLPLVGVLLSKGSELKATDLFMLGKELHNYGLLRSLVRELVVGFGFWAMLSLLARTVLTFLGVGLVDTLASLIATVVTFGIAFVEFVRLCLPPPSISLKNIMFNHSNGTLGACSLNMCKNATQPIVVPEWTHMGRSEAVAYNCLQVTGSTIRAQFMVSTVLPYTVEIRAIAQPGNPFGDLAAQNVSFVFYQSAYYAFTINPAPAVNLSVGQHTVDWQWEFRENPSQPWATFDTSRHTIYLLQGPPAAPWNNIARAMAGSQCVWSDMLELSSPWLGAGSVLAGANLPAALTLGIINSGAVYEGAQHSYLQNYGIQLNLSTMMTALRVVGTPVECSECAALLVVVNALWGGTQPLVSILFWSPTARINTSLISAIGLPNASAVHGWNYHVIAQAGATLAATSPSYDCCLRLSSNNNPWTAFTAPFAPGEPTRPMQWGVPTLALAPPYVLLADYLDRLLALGAANRQIAARTIQITTII